MTRCSPRLCARCLRCRLAISKGASRVHPIGRSCRAPTYFLSDAYREAAAEARERVGPWRRSPAPSTCTWSSIQRLSPTLSSFWLKGDTETCDPMAVNGKRGTLEDRADGCDGGRSWALDPRWAWARPGSPGSYRVEGRSLGGRSQVAGRHTGDPCSSNRAEDRFRLRGGRERDGVADAAPRSALPRRRRVPRQRERRPGIGHGPGTERRSPWPRPPEPISPTASPRRSAGRTARDPRPGTLRRAASSSRSLPDDRPRVGVGFPSSTHCPYPGSLCVPQESQDLSAKTLRNRKIRR